MEMRSVPALLLTVALALLPSGLAAGAEVRRFPPGAGVVDVKARYGARGDGVTDDTAAIRKAVDENVQKFRCLYFPAGTYVVSDTISWSDNLERAKQFVMQGEGRERTVIRLRDRSPGFGDPSRPKIVLTTFSGSHTGMAFYNSIFDMTFDVGIGNTGAIALQYTANNVGTLRDVTIRSSDPRGAGFAGLDLNRKEPGPCLVKNVTVDGFDYGVDALHQIVFSVTFENVTLRRQRKAAIRNGAQILNFRRLRSENAVPALVQQGQGMTTIIDSRFTGGRADAAAIVEGGRGALFLRDIEFEGYGTLVDNRFAADVTGGERITEYTLPDMRGKHSAFPSPYRSLGLPIEETPEVPWDPPERWVVIDAVALRAAPVDTKVFQDAFDRAAREGKTTVAIPGGLGEREIKIGDTVRVHGSVRRVHGGDTIFGFTDDMKRSTKPVFRIEDVTADVVLVERMTPVAWGHSQFFLVEQNTMKTLVLRNTNSYGPSLYGGGPEGSRAFIENICSARMRFRPRQKVWMRQFDPESNELMLDNDGADVWIFGLKTESSGATVARTRNGGRTEVIGMHNYTSWKDNLPERIMWIVEDAQASFTYQFVTFIGKTYQVQVRETRRGETRDYTLGGGFHPLVTAYRAGDATPPGAPSGLRGRGLSPGSVELTWRESVDRESGIASYRIVRDGKPLAETVETRYVDRGLAEAAYYSYEVVAVNRGLVESRAARTRARSLADTSPPALVDAKAILPTRCAVVFTEEVEKASAEDATNYSLAGGASVESASLQADGRTVVLATSALPAGRTLTLSVRGVRDRAKRPNAIGIGGRVTISYEPKPFTPPADWADRGKDGNPYLWHGTPLWRLVRVWPPDMAKAANYLSLPVWRARDLTWTDEKHMQGGHPTASVRDVKKGVLDFGSTTNWRGDDRTKPSGVVFVAPAAGRYRLAAEATAKRWEGGGKLSLRVHRLDTGTGRAEEILNEPLPNGGTRRIERGGVALAAGQELAVVFHVDGMFTGAHCKVKGLAISLER